MPTDPAPHRNVSPLVVLAALFLGAMLAVPALAPAREAAAQETPAPDVAVPASDPAALALLRRAASVAVSRSWRGDEVVSSAGAGPLTKLLSVEHRALIGTAVTVLDGSTAEGATTFDADDPVMASATLPSSLGLEAVAEGTQWATLVANGYVTTLAGHDRVAGEPCTVLSAARVDGTVAATFWVSQASGLVLQRKIFDARGQLLRYSAFTEVSLTADTADNADNADNSVGSLAAGALAAPAAAPQPVAPASSLPAASPPPGEAPGVLLPATLAGTLTLVDARVFGASRTATTQFTYSDGLSSMTVSEQRGQLAAKPPPGWRTVTRDGTVVQERSGSPERVAWADRGTVFTVVSDTDDVTLDAALRALPRPAARVGYGGRMRSGFDRIGSWFDPTH